MSSDERGLPNKVLEEGRTIFGKGATIAKGVGKDGTH